MFPKILYLIGSAFCAQNPLHSFFYDHQKLPLDSRCTGIYLGFLIVFIFWLFRTKKKPIGAFPLTLLVPIFISIIYFIFDSFSSIFNMWWVTNFTRFFSGLFFGQSLTILVLMILSHSLWSCEVRNKKNKSIKIIEWKQWFAITLINLGIFILFRLGIKKVFYITAYLIILGLVLNIFLINLATLLTIFPKKIVVKKEKLFFILIPLVLVVLEFGFLIGFRWFLLGGLK